MLHFAGLRFDGVRSMSVISGLPARQSANSLAAADYAGRSFADGTLPQIAIDSRFKIHGAQGVIFATRLRQPTWAARASSSRLFWPRCGRQELSMTPQDAQLIETRPLKTTFTPRSACRRHGRRQRKNDQAGAPGLSRSPSALFATR